MQLLDTHPGAAWKMVNIQRHLPEDERAEKVIFVITDGLKTPASGLVTRRSAG